MSQWLSPPRNRVILGAGALVVLIAVIVFSRWQGPGPDDSTYFLAPQIEVGGAPQAIAVGEGGVWVTNAGDGTVSFIDPESAEVVGEPTSVGPVASGIAAGEGYVWVGFGEGATTISRIQPGSKQVLDDAIEIGRSPSSIAVGEGRVYVAAVVGDDVVAVDPSSAEVEFRAGKKALEFPSTVATGLGSVWVTDVNRDELVQLTPETLEVEDRIEVGTSPTAVTVGDGFVWVANFDNSVTRVDPSEGNKTEAIPVGERFGGLTVGEGFLWGTASGADLVMRVDTATGQVEGVTFPVGDNPQGIAYADGKVWVANQTDNTVSLIDLHPDE